MNSAPLDKAENEQVLYFVELILRIYFNFI
jgi:hypothetical protein